MPPAAGSCHTPLATEGGGPQGTGAVDTHCAWVPVHWLYWHVSAAAGSDGAKPKKQLSDADAPFLFHCPFWTVGKAAVQAGGGGGGGVEPPVQNGFATVQGGGGGGPP